MARAVMRVGLGVAAIGAATPMAFGQAGGLAFPENGGPISGTAQVGQAAMARTAETAWLNPAGMSLLDNAEVMVAAMPFYLDLEFSPSAANTVPGGDGGNQGGFFPGGGLFLAAPVSEDVAVGFSITSPYGLLLDPDDGWVGRGYMTEGGLITLNFQPSVSFRLNEQWSIGAGVDVQYADFEQDIGGPGPGPAAASINGDSWQVGATLGLLYVPTEETRLGLRYRSPIEHSLDGDLTIVQGRPASASLDLPQSVTFSAYHDLSEQVAVMADFGWTNWQQFERTSISLDVAELEIPRNWQDTWNFGLGFHYRPVEDWLLMTGFSWVSSAVDDADRTPDLPSDAQLRLSVGAEYAWSETFTVGANFTYLDLGSNDITQTRGPGTVAGDYSSADAYILGLYASWDF